MSTDMTTKLRVCTTGEIDPEDVLRFDSADRSFAIYRSPEGEFFATDGHCTHEQVHLADGLVIDHTIECPKHGGTFDYRTGEALAPPVCVNLQRFEISVEADEVFLVLPV